MRDIIGLRGNVGDFLLQDWESNQIIEILTTY